MRVRIGMKGAFVIALMNGSYYTRDGIYVVPKPDKELKLHQLKSYGVIRWQTSRFYTDCGDFDSIEDAINEIKRLVDEREKRENLRFEKMGWTSKKFDRWEEFPRYWIVGLPE